MRWRHVALVWIVCAGLGAEYWLVERRPTPAADTEPARPRFIPVGPAEAREVRLSRDGRTVLSRRDGGGAWTVLEPRDAAIPPDLIGAFANALTEAEEIAHLGVGGDPAAFGFDAGATRVEVRGEGGEPVVVTIGDANPTGTAVYARRQGAPDVVLIGRNIRYYEDLIFQALPAGRAPAAEGAPVGG